MQFEYTDAKAKNEVEEDVDSKGALMVIESDKKSKRKGSNAKRNIRTIEHDQEETNTHSIKIECKKKELAR